MASREGALSILKKGRQSMEQAENQFGERINKLARETSRRQMLVLEDEGQKTDRSVDLQKLEQNSGGFRLDDAILTLNGITRQFSIFVLAADRQRCQLNLRLEIKPPTDVLGSDETTIAEFWLGYLDFPMIDNTPLPDGQCAAVVLNSFEDDMAGITLICFPESYASLKQKAS